MSLEDQTIQNFISLVDTQWPLFAEYQGELEELCANLPLDKEEISDRIADWCESHPAIANAMDAIFEQQQKDRVPGTQGNAPPKPDPKLYQQLLDNAIRRNQSPSKTKP